MKIRQVNRRARRYLMISIGVLFALPVIGIAAFRWSSIPPSDASLQRCFVAHRSDLERLVAMMNEDNSLDGITGDSVLYDDEARRSTPPDSEGAISAARRTEYRTLFQRAGLGHGAFREEKSCDVELIAFNWGYFLVGGISETYVHCGTPTDNRVHTHRECLADKPAGSFLDRSYGTCGRVRYQKLAEGWYLFEDNGLEGC